MVVQVVSEAIENTDVNIGVGDNGQLQVAVLPKDRDKVRLILFSENYLFQANKMSDMKYSIQFCCLLRKVRMVGLRTISVWITVPTPALLGSGFPTCYKATLCSVLRNCDILEV